MSKITIAGDSIVITSAKTLEEIKTLEKYKPEALVLREKDSEGRMQEVFRVASSTCGIINANGACFNSATHDDKKFATITLPIPAGTPDAKEYAAETIGLAITKLDRVEEQFADAVANIKAEKDAVLAKISIA